MTLHSSAGVDTGSMSFELPATAQLLANELIERGVVLADEWQAVDEPLRQSILDTQDPYTLLAFLAEQRLLTEYQATRIRKGEGGQLVLGNYRILDRIGAGGMGTVFRAEHRLLRRPVAVKVLHAPPDDSQVVIHRFFVEMRALAQIRHPNIVAALDAGATTPERDNAPRVHYLVMEYVEGTDLEALATKTPMPISQACEVMYQIASALDETNKFQLIHRDIKPSNILVTPKSVAKLLDFGLAVHFAGNRMTRPGTLLGTLSYMAPEQVSDSTNVDIRADIFGLGATLFFCLTGQAPFRGQGSMTQQVAVRLTQRTSDIRVIRPDVSQELEAVIRRMMAHEREDRYPSPQSLLRALLPFVNASSRYAHRSAVPTMPEIDLSLGLSSGDAAAPTSPEPAKGRARVLIVDDEAGLRQLCMQFFRAEGFECQTAENGKEALTALTERNFNLVVLDIDMPQMSGRDTLQKLRQEIPANNPKVIMMSGGVSPDEMSELLALGADDYVAKPLNRLHLVTRAKAALAHKATEDRSEWLNRQLLRINAELEERLTARHSDLIQVRNALLFALAHAVETRSRDGARGHLTRVAQGAVVLARQARKSERLAGVIDDAFLQILEVCTSLHDIGYIAMPDHIVHPSAPLDPEDRIILQAHTTIGADTLASVAKRDPNATAFWQMAIDITRHHHERFDGAGYPDRLAGHDIPFAARIAAIADAYDMLRTTEELGYSLSHNAAVEVLVGGSRGRFDPLLVQVFHACEREFEEIFRVNPLGDCTRRPEADVVS